MYCRVVKTVILFGRTYIYYNKDRHITNIDMLLGRSPSILAALAASMYIL
jgi:hypothetical protein